MQPLAMNLRATIPVVRTYVYVIPLWFKSKVIYGLEKWELQQLVWSDLGLAVRIQPYKQVCQELGGGGGGGGGGRLQRDNQSQAPEYWGAL